MQVDILHICIYVYICGIFTYSVSTNMTIKKKHNIGMTMEIIMVKCFVIWATEITKKKKERNGILIAMKKSHLLKENVVDHI